MSFFKVTRGWQDSDFFGNAEFSDRDAWLWMIGEAEWKDTVRNVGGKPVHLKRGQFTSSVRFMAERFQWSTNRVLRYLTRLKKWGMAETQTETGQTIITICNYSAYQDGSETTETPSATPTETPAETGSETNYKKVKKDKNKNIKAEVLKPDDVSEPIWDDFIKLRKAKKATLTDTVLAGIRREAVKAGWVFEDALREMCERDWRGFKADWVLTRGQHGKQNRQPSFDNLLEGAGRAAAQHSRARRGDMAPRPDAESDGGFESVGPIRQNSF